MPLSAHSAECLAQYTAPNCIQPAVSAVQLSRRRPAGRKGVYSEVPIERLSISCFNRAGHQLVLQAHKDSGKAPRGSCRRYVPCISSLACSQIRTLHGRANFGPSPHRQA